VVLYDDAADLCALHRRWNASPARVNAYARPATRAGRMLTVLKIYAFAAAKLAEWNA
jgi:hypothetical protein